MKLALRPIEIETIRTDGGTQVREHLDEAWIVELMSLYEDGGHDIEPILVMIDGEGAAWLVDGFHRVEALRRLGWSGTSATVREGSLDAAKMLAAKMNKNGLPRTAGDKKRAILLALTTVEGKKMGQVELARHVGCSQGFVSTVIGTNRTTTSSSTPPRQRAVALLWARIDGELCSNAERPSADIARLIDCDVNVVRRRRRELGLPDFTVTDAIRARPRPTIDVAIALLKEHQDWSNRQIAKRSGVSPETVGKLRDRAGLPPRRPGPIPKDQTSPESQPSAPTRKGSDPRDGAEVIQLRPVQRISQHRTDAMRIVELMDSAERDAFGADLATRWPESFGGVSQETRAPNA